MGIFSRKYNFSDRDIFDFDDSFTPQDSMDSLATPPAPIQSSSAGIVSQPKKRRQGYSIEDAIKLMRELPEEQRMMVVSIVQKTLSSANIDVADIIEDASRKLARLEARSKQLNKEIEELEQGISQRRDEISKIEQDASETASVKSSFEGVSETTSSANTSRPASPKKPKTSQQRKAQGASKAAAEQNNPEDAENDGNDQHAVAS